MGVHGIGILLKNSELTLSPMGGAMSLALRHVLFNCDCYSHLLHAFLRACSLLCSYPHGSKESKPALAEGTRTFDEADSSRLGNRPGLGGLGLGSVGWLSRVEGELDLSQSRVFNLEKEFFLTLYPTPY